MTAMAIGDLTDSDAVRAALDEYDSLGREAFLDRYGFSSALRWYLVRDGKRYESKAIAGRAYGIQFPDRPPIRDSGTFTGGAPVVRKLRALGFEVTDRPREEQRRPDLEPTEPTAGKSSGAASLSRPRTSPEPEAWCRVPTTTPCF